MRHTLNLLVLRKQVGALKAAKPANRRLDVRCSDLLYEMHRRFLITKQDDLITATELERTGSGEPLLPALRFRSLSELACHFSSIGASADALKMAEETVALHGEATLELPVRF